MGTTTKRLGRLGKAGRQRSPPASCTVDRRMGGYLCVFRSVRSSAFAHGADGRRHGCALPRPIDGFADPGLVCRNDGALFLLATGANRSSVPCSRFLNEPGTVSCRRFLLSWFALAALESILRDRQAQSIFAAGLGDFCARDDGDVPTSSDGVLCIAPMFLCWRAYAPCRRN